MAGGSSTSFFPEIQRISALTVQLLIISLLFLSVLGNMAFAGFSQGDSEILRDSYFLELSTQTEPDRASSSHEHPHSDDDDSNSDSEICLQTSDVIHPVINTHRLAADFRDNYNFVDGLSDVEDDNNEATDDLVDPDSIIVEKTARQGCNCKKNCLSLFTEAEIYDHRLAMRGLEKEEKECMLLGKLSQIECTGTGRCKESGKRQRSRFSYSHNNKSICEYTFMFLHDIREKAFKNLKKHYHKNGINPRVHGNKGKRAPNAFSFQTIENVVKYVKNYVDENGLPMPSAPRGRNDIPPLYLPAYETKAAVHSKYVESCGDSAHVALTVFKNIWTHTLPHIQIMKPRSDLCFKCQKHREKVSEARTEEEKQLATSAYMNHTQEARIEREYYNTCIRLSKEQITQTNPQTGPHPPNSTEIDKAHYIFDYSQLFLLPHSSQQSGPIYFVTPRKVQCFGICNSAIPLQSNFLIDENETIGKDGTRCHGPNSIMSMIHEYLRTKSYGEKSAHFHCDNCSGQNKNKTMLHYMSWRCAKGLNSELNIHFMTVGHTKCMCDGCFGLARIKYIRSDCNCIADLVHTINSSASCNEVVRPPFPWYDWDGYFLPALKGLRGISKFHHFRFTNEFGVVYAKESVDSTEKRFDLKKSGLDVQEFLTSSPDIIPPAGLSPKRQLYLYKNVRQFVKTQHQDDVCPPPTEE